MTVYLNGNLEKYFLFIVSPLLRNVVKWSDTLAAFAAIQFGQLTFFQRISEHQSP